ncbi:MAG: Arc family DNA-binding protein [Pseudomonas sp.]|nr:Arc family DNA-binding protein [Pseudomonas sp.]
MDTEDRYTRITLRLPKELHAQLTAAADETSKSTNAEIVARLQESFADEARRQPLSEHDAAMHTLTALYRETMARIDEWRRSASNSEMDKIELLHEEATARYLRHAIARVAMPTEDRPKRKKGGRPLGIDAESYHAALIAENTKQGE